MNIKQMTVSAMERFIQVVDDVMNADDLTAKERQELIGEYAYRYAEKDMPQRLSEAIKRCQVNEDVHPTASSIVNKVTGNIEAYSPPIY